MSLRTTDKLVNLRLQSRTSAITIEEKNKLCRVCKQVKPVTGFSVDGSCADNRHPVCKTCENENAKPRREALKKEREWLKQFSPL
jgi:hypothetical protein